MKRVIVVAFEGAQTVDVCGPSEVFAAANRHLGCPVYRIVFASTHGRIVRTTSGLEMRTHDLRKLRPRPDDTVVVAGGEDAGVTAAARDAVLARWLVRAQRVVERLTSVCTGAFVLARAGLLDGRKATTHWSACDLLASSFPRVEVDRNAIFVKTGNVWTSAGVTTGIDMALAMVEADLGREVADGVASRLVLYVRRPGYQSQFSAALVAQTSASDPLSSAIAWAREHLTEVDVEQLAREAGLSLRTLHRRCAESLTTTPAKLLEKLRVEHARTLLSTSASSVKALAADAGFGSPARMKRAFQRELGVGPREYRLLFSESLREPPPDPPPRARRSLTRGAGPDRDSGRGPPRPR
ncbi:MAG TPA: helix-turn-helix domain-containing protein [Polyangiaceae bacterium]|jgi:transcriptional regulator GlxA family with amidase domain|nr:helix-turn-helix domain-containing protein [Polyangiaceae bacterium]